MSERNYAGKPERLMKMEDKKQGILWWFARLERDACKETYEV